jgi:two-component system OmpR family response regulator
VPLPVIGHEGGLVRQLAPLLFGVADDCETRSVMARLLELDGFAVTTVKNAFEARQVWTNGRFQLVVLDLMISGESEFDLFHWFRRQEDVPIVLVSVSGDEAERIAGLESGADDCIAKPFNPRELQARIAAVLRRSRESQLRGSRASHTAQTLHFDGWTLEPSRRRLLDKRGVEVPLTGGEYDLLLTLIDRPNQVMTRDRLLDMLHGRAAGPIDRAIDVAISRLRRKLNDTEPEKRIIKTVRLGGYVFVAPLEHERHDSALFGRF